MFHDLQQNRDHYGRVLEDKVPLYYERFDQDLLEKRPLVRQLVGDAFERLFPEKVDNLLDVGCGTGFYFPLLCQHAEQVTGVDVCEPMLDEARELIEARELTNCTVRQGSALELPFEDASMDVVHSWDFLHHVPDVAQAISEISRVLKPGGRYVVLEPNLLNISITWYHLRRRSEWRLFFQNQFSIPRKLRGDFEVRVSYDNTIISFLDEKTWWLWKAVNRFTSIPPFHLLSFRYVMDCRKKVA